MYVPGWRTCLSLSCPGCLGRICSVAVPAGTPGSVIITTAAAAIPPPPKFNSTGFKMSSPTLTTATIPPAAAAAAAVPDHHPPSPPPSSPPPNPNRWSYVARESSQLTEVFKVSSSHISFTHSPEPLHPYDSPTLHIQDPATAQILQAAAELLRDAKCVAFPTETVYGLGADACNTDGVKSIFSAKQRPLDNPLIVHVSSLRQLRALLLPVAGSDSSSSSSSPSDGSSAGGYHNAYHEGVIPEIYGPLISKFWPGPLTILLPLPKNSRLSPSVTAGQPTFAARLPEHPIALALCSLSGLPLAAPSANASGNPSPTTAAHVYTDLQNRIPFIIDGGPSNVGLESTVVDGLRNPPVILRPGGISVEQIRACGGVWGSVIVRNPDLEDHDTAPQAPGMKYKHYSPRAGVVLYEYGAKPPTRSSIRVVPNARIGFLRTRTWPVGFGASLVDDTGMGVVHERSLGTEGSEISRALFAGLRELDDLHVEVIYVEGIEEKDEGLAVMNRLRKAASVVVRNVS